MIVDWEYEHRLCSHEQLVMSLKQLGDEGWELVSIVPKSGRVALSAKGVVVRHCRRDSA